ncbi:MAG: HmuY family protein [Nitrospinota bacterium]|nr:HmuY family protein [Nitrospinota bacterium]
MNSSFDKSPESEGGKKRQMWRKLFWLNLCITLVLVGSFWLPEKLMKLQKFLDSPSVNVPEEGQIVEKEKQQENHPPIQMGGLLNSRVTTVNASSEKEYVYFNLQSGRVVKIHDPSSLEWDLAFRRSKVITNGGASSKLGKAGLIDLGTIEFEKVTEVPKDNYVLDVSTRTDTENPAILKPYNYNYLTHKLKAKKNVYAARTANNKFAKFQFLDFYCDNKEVGCIKIRFVYQGNGSNSFLKSPTEFTTASAGVGKSEESATSSF